MPAHTPRHDLVAELGLPKTLREVGVRADMLDEIAHKSMHDRLIYTNRAKSTAPRMYGAFWMPRSECQCRL